MRRILISLVLLISATGALAAEIDRAAAAIAGREATFTQRFTPKGFKNPQIESGTVTFGTLPAMRWSYSAPEAKLFVFDGTNSWFYVPADRQVTVGRVDDAKKRELPFLLIGDPAARDRYYAVTEKSAGGKIVTTLQPKDRGALVRDVAVTTNTATHLIERISYSDREGNQTTFDLTGYHPANAPAGAFRFDPPPGTQVVNAQ